MNVPVSFAAKVYKKDPSWIRAGLVTGYLPIGHATRNGKKITTIEEMDSKLGRINYYISPKLFYEDTGVKYEDFEEDSITLSNRNLELLYFCRQHDSWLEEISDTVFSVDRAFEIVSEKIPGRISDKTSASAIKLAYYGDKLKMLEKALSSCKKDKEMISDFVVKNTPIGEILTKYNIKKEYFYYHLLSFFKVLGELRQ